MGPCRTTEKFIEELTFPAQKLLLLLTTLLLILMLYMCGLNAFSADWGKSWKEIRGKAFYTKENEILPPISVEVLMGIR